METITVFNLVLLIVKLIVLICGVLSVKKFVMSKAIPLQGTKSYKDEDGYVKGRFFSHNEKGLPLIFGIHGGGTNSTYFDRPKFSYVETSKEYGCSIVLLDRPSYSGNKLPDNETPILFSVKPLICLIEQIWDDVKDEIDPSGIFIIGHSIGGATALELGSELSSHPKSFPLIGLAVTGVAIHHSDGFANLGGDNKSQVANGLVNVGETLAEANFGPADTYEREGYEACISTFESVPVVELVEISTKWPLRANQVFGSITVPVWHGLSEYEKIWRAGEEGLKELETYYKLSPLVETVLLKGGGHNYEFHKRGEELRRLEIEFGLKAASLT